MPDTQPDAQPPQRQPLAEELERRFGAGVDPEVSLGGQPQPTPASSEALLERLGAQGLRSTRYRLEGEIARGGMGAILKVWDADLRRHLAMKVILGKGSAEADSDTPAIDARTLGRFLEEAQVTGQLDHPGIVPVHELGIAEEGRVYFTMRLVKGRDLRAIFELVFAGDPDWTETRALNVVLRGCEALAYAHAKGVVHRDLKPGNVMVGGFGEVYVMDWGLARVVGREDRHDLRLAPDAAALTASVRTLRRDEREEDLESPIVTLDGDVLGTPVYMAPEQARGELEKLGPRSDVYAVGAILYHLLARQAPYVPSGARVSARTILSRVMDGPPAPLSSLRPDVPAELVAIVEQAMARDADRRYASTLELAEDLRAYLEHRVVRAYETGAWAEARKWVVRNRPLAAALAAAVVLLVAGLSASLVFKAQSDQNAKVASQNEQLAKANERRALDGEARALAKEQEARDSAQEAQRLQQVADASAKAARQQAYVAAILGAQAAREAGEPATVRRLLDSAPEDLRNWEWNYLNAASDVSLVTIQGACDLRSGGGLSRDGRLVATIGADHNVRIVNIASGSEAAVLQGHRHVVLSACFSPDGRRIVTASVDGTVRVWDVSNGTQVLESAELGGALRFASFSPDGTKVLINAGTVAYIIDAEDGSQIAQLEGHRGSIASAAFSPIGNTVVTAALDFTSRIWDVTNGAQIFRLQRDWNGVTCASYSPDASLVVTGTDKGVCHLWSATTGTWIASVDAHKDSIRCLRFDRDGKRLVVASADATASAWDLSTGELLSRLEGHLGWVTYAVFDSDGSRIATSSRDGSVRVWSTMTGTELSKLEGHAGDVECVAFSADGTQVISSGGGTTRIWDASHCWPHLLMVPGGSAITTAQLSPDGARILTAVDQFVHLWDVLAGDRLATLVGDEHDLLRASFDGDGARILTVESDGDVRVWDALTGVQLAVFHGAVESIDYPNWRRQASAGLCAAGGRVVVASTGGVDLWDVRSGTNLGELEVLGSGAVGVPRCTVNRDGSRVATSVTGEAVHVWDATSGELIATCHPGSDGVDFLEFSADGVRLLMMAAGAASVWDARSGTLVRDSIGGHQSINRVHISPDGALVAVMPSWGSVQVWSVDNGVQLTQLEGHARPVEAIDFSHDGTRIVTTGGDGSVRVWDPRTGVQLLKLDVHLDRSGGAPVWTTVQFSSDGTRLLSSAAGSTVHLWDSVAHRTRFAARLDLQRAQPVAEAYVAEALGHQSNLFDVGERIRSDPTMEPGVRRVALEILIRHADKARIKEEVLRVAQAEHLWISRMLGLEPWPDHEQVEAEIEGDAELPNGSWELDLIASSLVDDHGPLGDPVRALILARRAFAKSGGGALHYTLSQALFRLGRFDEALEHDRLAVASVEEDLRRHFAGRTARLQSDIAAWRDESGQLRREEWMAKLEELDREIAELEADPDVRLWRASQL